jgi:hypothetical protein
MPAAAIRRPPSALRQKFHDEGVADGEKAVEAGGGKAPAIAPPPTY